ncbi:zinc finger and SCAN domain-containing protein 30 [Xyrauchen texanus]|uniref:zinc finger and SCAN domain-containing protein 30 n=1 Tax=Xyrauchen texanus TaxID=154827 RepID=UPI002241DBE1|nr:zinc finger and SCAN domain-containing protein 30 [Xyrauchen texanus]
MSSVILTFQSQLSGVMETVFKAAMFEITRLVEESFVNEVSRSREQVETLKKRLQWSESRRKNQETSDRRLTCTECGKPRSSNEERVDISSQESENQSSLKQETVVEGSWRSCDLKTTDIPLVKERSEDQTSLRNTEESVDTDDKKLDCILKEEAFYATADNKELQDGWTLDTEGPETSDFSAHSFSERELQQIQDDWSSGLDQTTDNEPYADIVDVQGLPYRTRYNTEELSRYSVHELNMGDLNGQERTEDTLGNAALVGPIQNKQGIAEEVERHHSSSIRSKRGNRGSLPAQVNPARKDVDRDMHCLLINEDGHLQDMNVLMEAAEHRGHSLYVGDTANDATGLYKGNAFNISLDCKDGQVLGDNRASLNGNPLSYRVSSSAAYTCNQCGKNFTLACNLKVHQRVHQREGLHLCSHCGKGYSSFSDLRTHRCSQTGDKPYTCTLCGSKFSRLWNLKLHKRIHTQEKPHKCTLCSKSFTRADILKVHQRTHTGERPYSCGICGQSFKRPDHLRSHQRKHGADLNNA